MKQEAVPLTQRRPSTYAREGVIFMVETDTQVIDKEAKPQEQEAPQQEDSTEMSPKEVHKQVVEVLSRLQERVAEANKGFYRELDLADADDFRQGLNKLKLNEIEEYLKEIKNVGRLVEENGEFHDFQLRRNIATRQTELEHMIAARKAEIKEHVEGLDVGKEVSLNGQVFATFQKFMGLDGVTIQTDPSVSKMELRSTDDGQQVIVVQEPTLANMIEIAKELSLGKFSEPTREHFTELAHELKVAAVWMEMNSFEDTAVAVLYNAGYQLEQLVEDPTRTIYDKSYRELFTKELRDPTLQHEAVYDTHGIRQKAFFDIFLGRNLDVPLDQQHTLYAAYFRRWVREHPDLEDNTLSEQQQKYESWLLEPDNQITLVKSMRRLIERSLRPGNKGIDIVAKAAFNPEEMQNILDPWRLLVQQAEGQYDKVRDLTQEEIQNREQKRTREAARAELSERLKKQFPRGSIKTVGFLTALDEINRAFRPGREVEAKLLDYVPEGLIKEMAAGNRDAAACIVAIAYEKGVLEEILKNKDGTTDYVVLPEIIGKDAQLLVVDVGSEGNVYRINPNIPRDMKLRLGEDLPDAVTKLAPDDPLVDKIYEQINAQLPEDLAENALTKIYPDTFSIQIQHTDENGEAHTLISGEEGLTTFLLSNFAALDSYWQGQDPEVSLPIRMQAAKDALRVSTLNPFAKEIVAALEKRQSANEIVSEKREEQKQAVEDAVKITLENALVGRWVRPPTFATPEVEHVVNKIEAAINALPPTTNQELRDLPDRQLDELIKEIDAAKGRIPLANSAEYNRAGDLMGDLKTAFNLKEARRSRLLQGERGDILQSFNLTGNEQEIFIADATPENIKAMRDKIEQIVHIFTKDQKPEFVVTTNAANIAYGKIDDIVKLLTARPDLRDNTDIQQVRLEALRNTLILIQPFQAAAELSTGDPDAYVRAAEALNKMDSAGGNEAIAALLAFQGGRSRYFFNQMAEMMDWIREQNTRYKYNGDKLDDVSVGSISANEYKEIRKKLVEREIDAAFNGRGLYASVWQEIKRDYPIPADATLTTIFTQAQTIRDRDDFIEHMMQLRPPLGYDDKQFGRMFDEIKGRRLTQAQFISLQKDAAKEAREEMLRDKINEAAIYGQLAFRITERPKEFGSIGEDTKPGVGKYDPTQNAWVDQEKHDLERWAELSEARQKFYKELLTERVRVYVRLTYGEKMLKQLDKHPEVLDRIRRYMGYDLTAHYAKTRWQSEYLFGRVDEYAIKQWTEKKYGVVTKDDLAGMSPADRAEAYRKMFGLFITLHDGSVVIKPGVENDTDLPEDTNPLVDYILSPEAGYFDKGHYDSLSIEEEKDAYKKQCVQYGVMAEAIARLYPDMLMKQFAFEPDFWEDPKGGHMDPRFVSFFTSENTRFIHDLELIQRDAQTGAVKPDRINLYVEAVADLRKKFGKRYDLMADNEREAQIRFHIFQKHVAPLLASIRHNSMDNPDPSVDPLQVDFSARAFDEFNMAFGAGVAGNVQQMMGAMSHALVATGGHKHIPGIPAGRNNLIGRLAFDPSIMQALYHSPLSLDDVPYWMLHGKDREMHDHPIDVTELYGGGKQAGRTVEYVKGSHEMRAALNDLFKADPNNFQEEIFKRADAIAATMKDAISQDMGSQVRLTLEGKFMQMATVQGVVGALGLEKKVLPGFLPRDSRLREIFDRFVIGLSDDDAKTHFQRTSHLLFKPEHKQIFHELMRGKKRKRFMRTFLRDLIAMIILTSIQSVVTVGENVQAQFAQ